MISRRAFFGIGFCGRPALAGGFARQCKPGDLVRIVALRRYREAWEQCKNTDLKRSAALLRRCLGGTYRVVYVGDDGRLELDVFETAKALDERLTV